MRQENVEAVRKLIDYYGANFQYGLAMEECAELSVVCSKLRRGGVPRETVVDAIADVYVMIQALVLIGDVDASELEDIAYKKLQNALADAGLLEHSKKKPLDDEPLFEDENYFKDITEDKA